MQNLLAINDINEKINAKAQQPEQTNDLYEVISVQLMRSRL